MTQDPIEERVVHLMVRALREHPDEWLTFRRLSLLIAPPRYDGDLLAGIADYRPDLFIVAKDKRLRLQPTVAKEVVQKGIEKWKVPAPRQYARHRSRGTGSFESAGIHSGQCYGRTQDLKILGSLKTGAVPDQALACSYCWQEIYRVRGIYFNSIDPEMWEEICRRRGYILLRQNPRGF